MEEVLSHPQLQDELLDDELLEQQYEIRGREESFRRLLARLTVALVFLGSSLTVYFLLPFYPAAMAALLALVPAFLAFRWPAFALFIMLLFAAPAFSYQLDVTIWSLGIMAAIAVILPFGLGGLPGASSGAAIGTACGALMLTPYFYLSLPLLVGSTVLRLRGSTVGGGWALFMFLALYIPFLAVGESSTTDTIPLFTQVDYAERPALTGLDVDSLKAAFDSQVHNSFSGFSGLSAYFVRGWGGVALILTLLMATVVVPAIVNTAGQLRLGGSTARALTPLVLLMAALVVFLLPLQMLAESLGYHTGTATFSDIARLAGIMFGLGVLAFMAERWIHGRNLKVDLRTELAILALVLYDLLDSAKQRLVEIAAVWQNTDLATERAAISQYEEKVALALESSSAMGIGRLEVGYSEFRTMQTDIPRLQDRLERRLRDHLDESRRAYRTTVQQALALGIPTIEDVIESPRTLEAGDPDQPLREQEQLNSAFQRLAEELVSTGDMVASTIKNEIDPEFSLTTIEISHGFLNQRRYPEAARTITEDLQIIDGRIEGSIVDLANKVVAATASFREVLTSRLLPVLESIGDSGSVAACTATIRDLDTIDDGVRDSRTLADIIGIVEHCRKLTALATDTVRRLAEKTNNLETDNNRRCPPKYNWGKNSHTATEIRQLLDSIMGAQSESTISGRFSIIDSSIRAVEQQTATIKHYAQVNEFLINYPNIEYIVREKLSASPAVASSDLPVQPKYALEYLKIYATAHQGAVLLDAKTGILKRVPGNGTHEDESAP